MAKNPGDVNDVNMSSRFPRNWPSATGVVMMTPTTLATTPAIITPSVMLKSSPKSSHAKMALNTNDQAPRQLSTTCGAMPMATRFTTCAKMKTAKPNSHQPCR